MTYPMNACSKRLSERLPSKRTTRKQAVISSYFTKKRLPDDSSTGDATKVANTVATTRPTRRCTRFVSYQDVDDDVNLGPDDTEDVEVDDMEVDDFDDLDDSSRGEGGADDTIVPRAGKPAATKKKYAKNAKCRLWLNEEEEKEVRAVRGPDFTGTIKYETLTTKEKRIVRKVRVRMKMREYRRTTEEQRAARTSQRLDEWRRSTESGSTDAKKPKIIQNYLLPGEAEYIIQLRKDNGSHQSSDPMPEYKTLSKEERNELRLLRGRRRMRLKRGSDPEEAKPRGEFRDYFLDGEKELVAKLRESNGSDQPHEGIEWSTLTSEERIEIYKDRCRGYMRVFYEAQNEGLPKARINPEDGSIDLSDVKKSFHEIVEKLHREGHVKHRDILVPMNPYDPYDGNNLTMTLHEAQPTLVQAVSQDPEYVALGVYYSVYHDRDDACASLRPNSCCRPKEQKQLLFTFLNANGDRISKQFRRMYYIDQIAKTDSVTFVDGKYHVNHQSHIMHDLNPDNFTFNTASYNRCETFCLGPLHGRCDCAKKEGGSTCKRPGTKAYKKVCQRPIGCVDCLSPAGWEESMAV